MNPKIIPMWSDRARQWVWVPTDGSVDAALLDMLSTEQRQKVESLRVTTRRSHSDSLHRRGLQESECGGGDTTDDWDERP